MMKRNLTHYGWILAAAAVLAWCGVVFFIWSIESGNAAYRARASELQISSNKEIDSKHVHALAVDISDDSARLSTILQVNPVDFAKTIQSAGVAAGTNIQIINAAPENVPTKTPAKGAISIHTFGYTIETSGSYAAVMRTIQLLETLPGPASLEQITLQQDSATPGSKSPGLWHLDARIRLITTADIFS